MVQSWSDTVNEEEDEDDDDEEVEDEEVEDEEDVTQPKRMVPQRSTRGRRTHAIAGEAAKLDREFWGHDTWNEDREDQEWSTEDEAHYDDHFESDFNEPTESEGEEEQEEEAVVKKVKKSVYIDPQRTARKTPFGHKGKRSAVTKTTTPVRRKLPWTVCRPGGSRYREPKQSQHLAQAVITEKLNVASLCQQRERENLKKIIKSQTQSIWKGTMECGISWASDRLIETEENKKTSSKRKSMEAESTPPADDYDECYCRELLFFIDFSEPQNSRIPEMYSQVAPRKRAAHVCAVTGAPAKYYDPMLRKYYSSAEAFRVLRMRYHKAEQRRETSRLAAITEMMEAMSKTLLQTQAEPATTRARHSEIL